MAKRKVREYNRTFTPPRGKGKAYTIANIPAALWAKVQVRARREGVSIRAELLRYLTAFAEGARVPVIAREEPVTYPVTRDDGEVVYVTVPDSTP